MAIGFLHAADNASSDCMDVGASKDREVLDMVIVPRAARI